MGLLGDVHPLARDRRLPERFVAACKFATTRGPAPQLGLGRDRNVPGGDLPCAREGGISFPVRVDESVGPSLSRVVQRCSCLLTKQPLSPSMVHTLDSNAHGAPCQVCTSGLLMYH